MNRFALLSLLLLAAPAAAAPSRLDTLLARGEALTRAADPACAEPLQAAAFEAEKTEADYLRALAALGLCREVQGRYADAHQFVSRALEGAPAETTPAGRAPRWVTLRAAQRRLDERIARVLVNVRPKSAEVFLDGQSVGTADGKVLVIEPGSHVFEAREKGRVLAAAQVTARAGDLPSVDLFEVSVPIPATTPQKAGESGPIPTAPIPRPHPLAPALTPRGVAVTTAYVAGGIALVAGVVAGVLEAQRAALASGIPRDGCPTPDASPRCESLRLSFDQSRGARNVALGAGVLAGVAAGTGIVLWITEERQKTAAGLTWSGTW